MAEDEGEKTEEATPKRKQEATDEGRIAHTAALGPGILRVTGMLKGMEGDR